MSDSEWKTFMVYGGFTIEGTKNNFFIVRIPNRKLPWAKKIAPAIDRLVRTFYPSGTKSRDRFWNVEGEDPRTAPLWERAATLGALKYEWNGQELVPA